MYEKAGRVTIRTDETEFRDRGRLPSPSRQAKTITRIREVNVGRLWER